MKRIALPLAVALMAGMASCTSDTSSTTGWSQAQIDSAVNIRVEEMRMEMERSNDSLINMMAQAKADSMVAAMKGGTPAPTRPTAGGGKNQGGGNNGGTGTQTPPPPPPNSTTGKNNDGSGQTTGKKSTTDAGGNTVQQGQTTGKRK